MSKAKAPVPQRVALLGFGEFERNALKSWLRLSSARVPAYQQADSLASADYVIADADHAGIIDDVMGADRVADTVFIGSLAPDGALAWAMRPIDPLQVFRELDATVALRAAPRAAPAATPKATEASPATEVLPAAASAKLPASETVRSARRAGDAIAPTTALLVDPDETGLHALDRQLQGLGLRTDTAATSQQAMELLGRNAYDVVFLELDLGLLSEFDGLALCQHIRQHPRRLAAKLVPKLVLVSTQPSATDRVRGSFAGCDGYLAKPLDDESLRRNLRQLGLRLAALSETGPISRPGSLHSLPLPPEMLDDGGTGSSGPIKP